MTNINLCAGALSLLLRHSETGCQHAASQAASLLERIADSAELDRETRGLCDRASERLHRLTENKRKESHVSIC